MTKNTAHCDHCKNPIDETKGKIEFVPVRGGLTVAVHNGTGQNAGLLINQRTEFCNESCLDAWLGGIRSKIKVPPTPAPKPAEAKAPDSPLATAAALLLALCCLFFAGSARAGTFFSFTSISGTNYAQVFQSYANPYAYPAYVAVPQQTLTLTNCFTNEQIWLAYGAQITGQPGNNVVVSQGFFTNLTGANGWTVFPTNFTYVTPAYATNVYVTPYGVIGISSNGLVPPYPAGTNGALWF